MIKQLENWPWSSYMTTCGQVASPIWLQTDWTQPLPEFELRYDRNEGMARAYLSGQHTMAAIAIHFEVHYSTVSRAVKDYENKENG